MKIIKPSVRLIEEDDVYKKIELAGRICYKSEDKITDTSHEKFIKMLVKNKHLSVLEHADIDLYVESGWERLYEAIPQQSKSHFVILKTGEKNARIFSANLRAWKELSDFFPIEELSTKLPLIFGEEDKKIKWGDVKCISQDGSGLCNEYTIRETFAFTTSRDISHQIVRHRLLSFSQESQRYCNYIKGGFGDIKFIMPEEIANSEDRILKHYWKEQRKDDEAEYESYISSKLKPEIARSCLPNATATSLVATGSLWAWKHFVSLRESSTAQPGIRFIAKEVREILEKKYRKHFIDLII